MNKEIEKLEKSDNTHTIFEDTYLYKGDVEQTLKKCEEDYKRKVEELKILLDGKYFKKGYRKVVFKKIEEIFNSPRSQASGNLQVETETNDLKEGENPSGDALIPKKGDEK